MRDTIMLGIVAILGPALPVALFSFILHYFVALKSPPASRALWTAGLAYVATSIFLTLTLPLEYAVYIPFAAAPAGLVAYLFWRSDFTRDWLDRVEDLPEGTELLDDDWRVGLLRLGLMVLAVVAFAFVRWLRNS